MQFGTYLLRKGFITAEDFANAVEAQLRCRPALGVIAIESRMLSMHQLFSVLSAQAECSKPFGRIAVDLGYISEQQLMELLGLQCEQCLPLSAVLVEFGILSEETVSRELHSYRKVMSSDQSEHEECSIRERDKLQKVATASATQRRVPRNVPVTDSGRQPSKTSSGAKVTCASGTKATKAKKTKSSARSARSS